MKSKRHMIVQTKHHIRTLEITSVPQIKLEGRWLEELGFKQGEEVEVELEKEKITIRVRNVS